MVTDTYDVKDEVGEVLASGLSTGELCQWLLDCFTFDGGWARLVYMSEEGQAYRLFTELEEAEEWLYNHAEEYDDMTGSYSINFEIFKVGVSNAG